MSQERGKKPPPSLWVILDGDDPVYVADWPDPCHERVNSALMRDCGSEFTLVVREYVLKEDAIGTEDTQAGRCAPYSNFRTCT